MNSRFLVALLALFLVTPEAFAQSSSQGSQSRGSGKSYGAVPGAGAGARGSAPKFKATPSGSSGRSSGRSSGSSSSPSSQIRPTAPQEVVRTPEIIAFEQLREEIQQNRSKIDQLTRNMPIGFPEQRKKAKDLIEVLKKANEEKEAAFKGKAMAAFVSSPSPDPISTQVMLQELRSHLPGAPGFNPDIALEIVRVLQTKQAFASNPFVLRLAFDMNFATENFEDADKAMVKLEGFADNLTPDERLNLQDDRDSLDDTRKKFQREIKIRRLEASTNDLPRVLLKTTEGDIVVELFENHAPNTVANFIQLVTKKYYDGKTFYLSRPGAYSVTGSPTNDSKGNAGYYIKCECYNQEIRHHFRGTLTMLVDKETRDKGSAQFLITHQPPKNRNYDGTYTAFGRVLDGMDVLLKLKQADPKRPGVGLGISGIIHAEVIRSRSHDYSPDIIRIPGVSPYSVADGASGSGTSDGWPADVPNPTGSPNSGSGTATDPAGSGTTDSSGTTNGSGTTATVDSGNGSGTTATVDSGNGSGTTATTDSGNGSGSTQQPTAGSDTTAQTDSGSEADPDGDAIPGPFQLYLKNKDDN